MAKKIYFLIYDIKFLYIGNFAENFLVWNESTCILILYNNDAVLEKSYDKLKISTNILTFFQISWVQKSHVVI